MSSELPVATDIDLEPITPEAGDNHLNVEFVLAWGGVMERGWVVGHKCDTEGDPIGRDSGNPILDTRRYDVEFNDGQVTELIANIIAKSM